MKELNMVNSFMNLCFFSWLRRGVQEVEVKEVAHQAKKK